MSNLINVYDFEIIEGKKLSNKSTILKTAFRNMKAKNKFHIEEDEDVFSPAELLLMCYDISIAQRKKEIK